MNPKLFEKLSQLLVPIAGKLGQSRYLSVLRDAFMLSFPLTIFGSIVVVLMNLPFLNHFLNEDAIGSFQSSVAIAQEATMSIMTLFVVFGIGYYLSKSYNVDAIFGGAIALVSFFFVTPFNLVTEAGEVIGGVIPVERLGAKGMFVGMLVAFCATEIYRLIIRKNWTIKMPTGVPEAVAKSFSALIPTVITLSTFLLINITFVQIIGENLHDLVYEIVQRPLVGLGSGLGATLVTVFFIQILWFFGLHGQIIVNSIMDPIWNTLSLENLNAFTATGEVPHIISKQFIDVYTVGIGGTGMTLGVIIAILIFMKSKQMKQVAKLGLASGMFNVNEPIIFGLPIVMNPLFAIPWIIAPMVVTAFTYLSMSLGIVPPPTGVAVPWTVPIFFSGMLATNSILGGLLQIVNLLIVILIWLPFLRMSDMINIKNEVDTKI